MLILNYMVQYNSTCFDASFGALADATRRRILEQAGFIATRKIGRVRTCTLGPRQLKDEAAWIAAHHTLWDARFIQLDKVVADLKLKEENDDREY